MSFLKPGERLGSSSSSPGLSKSVLNMKFMKSREPTGPPTVSSISSSAPSSSNREQNNQEKSTLSSQSTLQAHSLGMSSELGQMNLSANGLEVSNGRDTIDSVVYIQETKDPLSLLPGRRSFQNCNAAVERNYRSRMDELNLDISAAMGGRRISVGPNLNGGVSDEEMLERYQHLVGLPRGPNQSRKPVGQHRQQPRSGGQQDAGGRHSSGKHDTNSPSSAGKTDNHRMSSQNSGANRAESQRKQPSGREDKYPMKKIRK